MRSSPVTGPLRGAMDEMLRADLDAPPKQRHTAHRIWERLVDEHDARIAARQQATYNSFLSELLFIECEDREVRRKVRRNLPKSHHGAALSGWSV